MSKVKGYRELSSTEIELINEIKSQGEVFGALVQKLRDTPDIDQRWVSTGCTDLQKGCMSLVRSVAQPSTF